MGTTMDALNHSTALTAHRAIDARAIDARAIDARAIDARAMDARAMDARAMDPRASGPQADAAQNGPSQNGPPMNGTAQDGPPRNGPSNNGSGHGHAGQARGTLDHNGLGYGGFGHAAAQRQRRRVPARGRVPLSRTITDEVVPLLVLAHRAPQPHAAAAATDGFAAAIAELTVFAMSSEVDRGVALIEALHARGASLDTLYLDVITGAARLLGQMWHDDRASFTDVTIGTLALQRLLHALDHAFCFCAETTRRDPARRMLLAPRPGEPHCFALDLLGAFLRRAGWEVVTVTPRDEAALMAALHDGWFALLGISDSCGGEPESLAAIIHAARRASQNRSLRVMVGGPAFIGDPDRALRAGADATASDAAHAVTQAEGLFALARDDA